MIPYQLFMFRIIWPDKIMDIRACDPMGNGFSFRVAKNRLKELEEPAKYVVCFLGAGSPNRSSRNRTHEGVREYPVDGRIEVGEEFCFFYTEDERFRKDFQALLADYMEMVQTRLENDDLDAMTLLTGIEISEDFMTDEKSWRQKFCKRNHNYSEPLKDVEIGISLDSDDLREAFLQMEWAEFQVYYRKRKCLEEFEIAHRTVTHVYVGNQFCLNLLPDEKDMKALLSKIYRLGMQPVIALAPVPQSRFGETVERLKRLTRISEENGASNRLELVINDYGVAEFFRENYKDCSPFLLTAGLLLNKRKKDPRLSGYFRGETIASGNAGNMFQDAAVIDFLQKELGISAVSYDACGYAVTMDGMPSVLHLPLYQTNTSNCVTFHLCQNKDRGKMGDSGKCPHYCRNLFMAFPDNLPFIGIGNTVYGISDFEINDTGYINERINSGLKRIVLN